MSVETRERGEARLEQGLLPITRMLKAGAVFDIIDAVLCVVGVIAMANAVGLS